MINGHFRKEFACRGNGQTATVPSVSALYLPALAGAASRANLMNFIIWIVIGGILGWLASMVMKTDAQQGLFLNIIVGIVGALLGGWLLAPLFGTGTINQNDFSIGSLLVSFLGAIILLAVVNLLRRGTTR